MTLEPEIVACHIVGSWSSAYDGGRRRKSHRQMSVTMLYSDNEPALICISTALLEGTVIHERKALAERHTVADRHAVPARVGQGL